MALSNMKVEISDHLKQVSVIAESMLLYSLKKWNGHYEERFELNLMDATKKRIEFVYASLSSGSFHWIRCVTLLVYARQRRQELR